MRIFHLFFLSVALSAVSANASPLTVGQTAPQIKLDGDLGGRVNGEAWSSAELLTSGKIVSLFYVDPEEKSLNEAVEAAYDKERIPLEKHDSIAVINMAAAWYPNSMINSMLKKKQSEFPSTIYVKDLKKTLVSAWELADDSVNLVVFGKDGKVLFLKKGKMSPDEIPGLMKLIRDNL